MKRSGIPQWLTSKFKKLGIDFNKDKNLVYKGINSRGEYIFKKK